MVELVDGLENQHVCLSEWEVIDRHEGLLRFPDRLGDSNRCFGREPELADCKSLNSERCLRLVHSKNLLDNPGAAARRALVKAEAGCILRVAHTIR